MSRTYKDRPYYVLERDKKWQRRERHVHEVLMREKVGEEPVICTDLDGKEYVRYYRNLYKRWYVPVDCTIDKPTDRWGPNWYHDYFGKEIIPEDYKYCYHWLVAYPNIRSHKDFKHAANSNERAKVRQQMKQAVNTYGWNAHTDPFECYELPNGYDDWGTVYKYVDAPNWSDVDIRPYSKYNNSAWWD